MYETYCDVGSFMNVAIGLLYSIWGFLEESMLLLRLVTRPFSKHWR
jgi:hypothetical protein